MKKLVVIVVLFFLTASCNWKPLSGTQLNPTRWPCGPIYYAINPGNTQRWQNTVTHSIMTEMGAISGRKPVFLGYTNMSRRNGATIGFILIEHYWPSSAPYAWGWTSTLRNQSITGANILINAPTIFETHVQKHEIGHAVGLDHVVDKTEIMDPYSNPSMTKWGPGTQIGLRAVGRC